MKFASRIARPRSSKSWSSEAGQGTLEYILILIVSVLMILGILYQFNAAFKSFVTAYFSDYVSCLLEVGDLPGIASECAMPTFDMKNGKKLITALDNGGSSSSSSTSGSSTSSSSASSSSSGGKGSSSSSASSSGGGGQSSEAIPANSGSRSSSSGGGRSKRGGTTAAGSLPDGARGTQDDVLGISPTSTAVGRYTANDRSRVNNMAWGYYDTREEEQKKDEEIAVPSSNKSVAQNGKLKGKATKFESTRKIASADAGEDEGFSAGAWIRILMIILMIIAIVIFFGGQILQITKSGDE